MTLPRPLAAAILLVTLPLVARATSFEEAREIARRQDKPVLVDFFAVWCGPCKAFTKAAETDPDVRKALEGVVLCKVDAEKEGTELASAHAVSGYPTFVLMEDPWRMKRPR